MSQLYIDGLALQAALSQLTPALPFPRAPAPPDLMERIERLADVGGWRRYDELVYANLIELQAKGRTGNACELAVKTMETELKAIREVEQKAEAQRQFAADYVRDLFLKHFTPVDADYHPIPLKGEWPACKCTYDLTKRLLHRPAEPDNDGLADITGPVARAVYQALMDAGAVLPREEVVRRLHVSVDLAGTQLWSDRTYQGVDAGFHLRPWCSRQWRYRFVAR